MRKFFLLIPALVLSLFTNAAVINITPTSPHSSNNLRQAIAAANSGDIIEMAEGTYVETGDWIAVDDKAVTVRAAEGKEVIIQPQFSVRVKAGETNQIGKAEFIGVKFDCSTLSSDQLFVPSDDRANQSIVLKDCELYDWSKNDALIKTTSERRLDAIDIDNCYFHGFEKSIIFLQNTNQVSLSVTNSTFANITGVTDSYDAAPIDVRAATGSVLVDHCTFYNVNSKSLSYGTITVKTIANPVVSNCIFMLTTSADMCATNLKAGGDVTNCLTYNYDNWQPYGHYTTATVTDCMKADPLFKDAAHGDFSLYASSPAFGAGLAGSNLGDPRWAKALTPIAIPATLVPFNAILSENASIIQSTPDSIYLKSQENIEWAKWSVSVEESGLYNFTAYAKRTRSTDVQKLEIAVFNSDESVELISKSDNSVPNEGTISTGSVNLEAGNTYVIKVLNNWKWAESKLIKVEATYAGGKTIAVPDTLWPVDALRSERAFVNNDGEFRFTDDSHDGYVTSQWGKWNIHVGKAGLYSFTFNANSTNSHHYQLYVLNTNEELVTAEPYTLDGSSNQELLTTTPNLQLAAGDYIIKVTNTTQYSHGRVIKIIVNYEGGAVTALPGQIIGDDALLTGNIIRLDNRDLKSSNTSNPTAEYAEWNVSFAAAGTMKVQLNLDPTTSSGHNYRVELYNGSELKGYAEESASTDPATAIHSKGDIDLDQTIEVPAAGDYIVKLVNRTKWSSMILHGITFTPYVAPSAVTMNDTDAGTDAWSAYVGGASVNVTVNRTILGGMYNAICLPFALTNSQVKATFGNDVELYYLNGATLENEVLDMQFAVANDIYQGTPYLIKTSSNVVNPTFNGVSIILDEASTTFHTGWPVSFVGTFVQTTIDADGQNMLIYSNNQVGFPDANKTLKGFRAYFHLSSPSLAPSIKTARIITPNNTPTAINLVNGQQSSAQSQKLLIDGRLIIVRDGVQYNVIGARVK